MTIMKTEQENDMNRLKNMQDKVEFLLETYPATRDNDRLLIGAVYAHFYGVDVGCTSFKSVLLNDRLPSFESIRRVRAKVQADREDLRGTKAKEKERLEAQKDYLDYVGEKTDR